MLEDKWSLKANLTKSIKGVEFPLIDLGQRFTSSYQIVRVQTKGAKATWDFGGQVWAGYLVAGKQTYVDSYKLRIDNQQLIIVPLLFAGKYSLFYKAPKWFSNFTIKVYEYIGVSK